MKDTLKQEIAAAAEKESLRRHPFHESDSVKEASNERIKREQVSEIYIEGATHFHDNLLPKILEERSVDFARWLFKNEWKAWKEDYYYNTLTTRTSKESELYSLYLSDKEGK